MAYVSQEMKKELAPAIKAVLKKYGVKGSVSVRHHTSLVVTIREGSLDFSGAKNAQNEFRFTASDGNFYDQVNTYHIGMFYQGKAQSFLKELLAAMKQPTSRGEWFDHSDPMTDYFHRAYYTDINVGKWNKGYIQTV